MYRNISKSFFNMNTYTRIKTAIDGHVISYFELGNKSSASTILILHGWGLSAYVYLELAKLLAEKGFHVVAIDLPGFGFSFSPKEKWNYEIYGDFVSKFIIQVIHKKVTILGHSLGGGISLSLASKHDSLVERLVLIDSSGIPINLPIFIIGLKKSWEMIVQSILPGGFLPSIRMVWAFFLNSLRNPLGIYRAISLANKEDLSLVIKKLKVPALVLWAKKDMMESLGKGELISRLLDSPLILAPDSLYHDWCITNPEVFISKIQSILG